MIAYASVTGTRANLCAMRAHGIRLLYSPVTLRMARAGWRCALDNGAWTAYQRGVPLDLGSFDRAVDEWGGVADWVLAPDVVGDARATLALAEEWVPRLLHRCRLVLVGAQDGMTVADVPAGCGVAIGGSTAWKLAAIGDRQWRRADYLHVLRVNTRGRIHACRRADADSFDGTSPTMFSVRAPDVRRWSTEPVQEVFPWRQ